MRFAAYELGPRLAFRPIGEVHEALHRDPDGRTRPVRLVRAHPALLRDPSSTERFAERMRAVAELEAPGLAPVFEAGAHRGQLFVAFEVAEGPSLEALLADLPPALPRPSLAALVGLAVARALASAAEEGLLHGGLDPTVIAFDAAGRPVLSELGLAELREQLTVTCPRATAPESLAYAAPEQLREEPLTEEADRFSLGAVLYELLAGRRAFPGESVVEVAARIRECEPPPLAELAPETPAPLRALVERMLALDPLERPATWEEVAEALAPFAPEGGRIELAPLAEENSAEENSAAGPGAEENSVEDHKATSLDRPSFAQVQAWLAEAQLAENAATAPYRPAYRPGEAPGPIRAPSLPAGGALKRTELSAPAFAPAPPLPRGALGPPAEAEPPYLLLALGIGLLATLGLALGILIFALCQA